MDIVIDNFDFTTMTIRDQNGHVENIDIQEEVMIEEANLQKEFMTQSAKYAYWTALLEKVRVYAEAEERELDRVIAELTLSTRKILDERKEKYTKDIIESYVKLDSRYQNQCAIVEARNYQVKRLQYIAKVFEQRKDMIIQLGADNRKTNALGGTTSPYAH